MAGELSFNFRDCYPNMGIESTRTEVQPDADDQMALVDDQKVAQEFSKNPKQKFNIFMAVGALFLVAVILGVTR